MKGKLVKIGSILIAALLYYENITLKTATIAGSNQELTLQRPALSTLVSTYLDQEAGMAIYVNTTGPLNLDTAKNAMVGDPENMTADYVIGSLKWGTISSDDYPHCLVHKDGWIVVYYLKINLAIPSTTGWIGKIIDWSDVSQVSLPITNNLLYDGLYYIATQTLGKSITNAKYYHFQYPAATKLLFAIKHGANGVIANFTINIPDTVTIDERSWSCFSSGADYSFKIDTNQISTGGGRHYGGLEITEDILTLNVFHTISIYSYAYFGSDSYVCLMLLYH
jgi:hypothetical protein